MGHYFYIIFYYQCLFYFLSYPYPHIDQCSSFSLPLGLKEIFTWFFTIYCNGRYYFNIRRGSNLWIWVWGKYIRDTRNIWSWYSRNPKENFIFRNVVFVYTHQFFVNRILWNHYFVFFDISLDEKNIILRLR